MSHSFFSVLRPSPIASPVERVGEITDFPFLGHLGVEIGCGCQRAGQQERRIDRRQFAVPHAPAGLHVEEMIIEPAIARDVRLLPLRTVREEAQRRQRSRHRGAACPKTAVDSDRIAGKGQSRRSNAGGRAGLRLVDD